MKRQIVFALVLALVLPMISGCYWRKEVQEHQVGLIMDNGVSITQVVGAGRYTDMSSYYAEIVVINGSAQTVEWNDPDLVTSDKQPIGFSVGITYARKKDNDSIRHMWDRYNSEATNNDALQAQVLNRIPRVAKALTTQFTLDEMLGIAEGSNRTIVQNALFELLAEELDEINVELLDVGINNIAPDAEYMALLKAKASAAASVEVAQQETLKLIEQLKQEQAQTDIALEQARRDNLVNEERAKVLEVSDKWYELTKLDKLIQIFGGTEKIFFIDPNADVTTFFSGQPINMLPVQNK